MQRLRTESHSSHPGELSHRSLSQQQQQQQQQGGFLPRMSASQTMPHFAEEAQHWELQQGARQLNAQQNRAIFDVDNQSQCSRLQSDSLSEDRESLIGESYNGSFLKEDADPNANESRNSLNQFNHEQSKD